MTRERDVDIYILAEVTSATHAHCRDKDVEDIGTRECKAGLVASWEKLM